jgi:hypothetical protein
MSIENTIHFVDAILQSLTREADEAKKRFELLPRMPKVMPPECRAVWRDAAFSFVFGRDYAALCVCGAFVECLLEKAIPAFQTLHGQPSSSLPEALYELINLAREINLVTPNEAEILQDFRKLVRNRFAHGSVDAVADSLRKVEKVTEVLIQLGEVTTRVLTSAEMADIREATAAERLDAAAKEFAMPVMQWIGRWAARCATSVWEAGG